MRNRLALTVSALCAAVLLAFRVRAAPASVQDCATEPCVVAPLVQKPAAPPTATPVPPTPTTQPTATTGPAPTPTPLPPSFNNCQDDPNASLAPDYPVRIVGIDKQAETVTLQNVSANAVDLGGWTMCSITGNQHHPIGGVLGAGQSQTFGNGGGPIWNNSSSDPGALYDPNGSLTSYHFD
jgi:hypothetical protein